METKKGRLFGNTQTETLVRHHIDCPKHHRDSVRRSSVENKSTVPGSFEYILHRMIEEHGPLPKCTTPALTDGLLQRSGPLAGCALRRSTRPAVGIPRLHREHLSRSHRCFEREHRDIGGFREIAPVALRHVLCGDTRIQARQVEDAALHGSYPLLNNLS